MQEQEEAEELHYWGDLPEEEYYKQQKIRAGHSYYTSPRGLKLFTRSWLPNSSKPPRALICMVHGYGNDCSWTFQSTAIFLAKNGFACFSLDIEGHGRSQGLKAYVPNIDLVVNDCSSYFETVKRDPMFVGIRSFLYGESMGGAMCLLIHFANPNSFNGAVLVSPMCRIADEIKPKWPIPEILTFVAKFLPTLAIVPSGDVLRSSVKVKDKLEVAEMNPMRYNGKPRLGTVLELIRVTDCLAKRLSDVSLPFLVCHGSADVVTDPNVSKSLYEEARSDDKTLKIYDGMMHSLLFGETDENIEIVRRDILNWLSDRC
ncbi:Caffeoylshikimate esterase [Linum perenne]